jgi:hypothetical protein
METFGMNEPQVSDLLYLCMSLFSFGVLFVGEYFSAVLNI